MTQEELDALMNGDMDDIISLESANDVEVEEEFDEEPKPKNSSKYENAPLGYSDETAHQWPLPATDENKMVHQLDDVTKESEEKASEIFDIIEGISSELMEKEGNLQNVIEVLTSNIKLFTTLSTKFPDVKAFGEQLQKNKDALNDANETVETLQTSGDSIMNVMDIMQYQDIHRQKIERVINVMRALSKYMNTLFEGRIDDSKRVASATHISGDTHNDVASTDDIEALLAQFGQ
ncbi:MAG: chemotaxis protein [Campylobacterales bacterium]|nr:chemotaxis protein [Campylobacterales bacterium]